MKEKILRHFPSLWHFPQTSACPPLPLPSHSPELSVWPTATEFKLDSSAQWRARHCNTGKFNLNVKKILSPVISFLGAVTSSSWEQEGKSPRAGGIQPWVGRALRIGYLLDPVAWNHIPEVFTLHCPLSLLWSPVLVYSISVWNLHVGIGHRVKTILRFDGSTWRHLVCTHCYNTSHGESVLSKGN